MLTLTKFEHYIWVFAANVADHDRVIVKILKYSFLNYPNVLSVAYQVWFEICLLNCNLEYFSYLDPMLFRAAVEC